MRPLFVSVAALALEFASKERGDRFPTAGALGVTDCAAGAVLNGGVTNIDPRGAAQVTYSITDLGTLGGNNSVPIWVTNSGEVVGFSDTGQFDSSGFPIDHAFRWAKGVIQDLGTLGGNNSFAVGANGEGECHRTGRNRRDPHGHFAVLLMQLQNIVDTAQMGVWSRAISDFAF